MKNQRTLFRHVEFRRCTFTYIPYCFEYEFFGRLASLRLSAHDHRVLFRENWKKDFQKLGRGKPLSTPIPTKFIPDWVKGLVSYLYRRAYHTPGRPRILPEVEMILRLASRRQDPQRRWRYGGDTSDYSDDTQRSSDSVMSDYSHLVERPVIQTAVSSACILHPWHAAKGSCRARSVSFFTSGSGYSGSSSKVGSSSSTQHHGRWRVSSGKTIGTTFEPRRRQYWKRVGEVSVGSPSLGTVFSSNWMNPASFPRETHLLSLSPLIEGWLPPPFADIPSCQHAPENGPSVAGQT